MVLALLRVPSTFEAESGCLRGRVPRWSCSTVQESMKLCVAPLLRSTVTEVFHCHMKRGTEIVIELVCILYMVAMVPEDLTSSVRHHKNPLLHLEC
jgi:hypothetical protein